MALVDRAILELGIADDIVGQLAHHTIAIDPGEPKLAGVQAIADVIRIDAATGVVAVGGAAKPD